MQRGCTCLAGGKRRAPEPLCRPLCTLRMTYLFSSTRVAPSDYKTCSTAFASLFQRNWLLPHSVAASIVSSWYGLTEPASSSRKNPKEFIKCGHPNKWPQHQTIWDRFARPLQGCLINLRNRDLSALVKVLHAPQTHTWFLFPYKKKKALSKTTVHFKGDTWSRFFRSKRHILRFGSKPIYYSWDTWGISLWLEIWNYVWVPLRTPVVSF